MKKPAQNSATAILLPLGEIPLILMNASEPAKTRTREKANKYPLC